LFSDCSLSDVEKPWNVRKLVRDWRHFFSGFVPHISNYTRQQGLCIHGWKVSKNAQGIPCLQMRYYNGPPDACWGEGTPLLKANDNGKICLPQGKPEFLDWNPDHPFFFKDDIATIAAEGLADEHFPMDEKDKKWWRKIEEMFRGAPQADPS